MIYFIVVVECGFKELLLNVCNMYLSVFVRFTKDLDAVKYIFNEICVVVAGCKVTIVYHYYYFANKYKDFNLKCICCL